jgi:phosphate/sulfate permease
MPSDLWLLGLIILVALTFDFLNGFHDAANSIATVVSTRVLSPQKAVLWAAFFNFVAAFVLGTDSTRSSASCSSSRRASTASATAATTPRRRWASSRGCS